MVFNGKSKILRKRLKDQNTETSIIIYSVFSVTLETSVPLVHSIPGDYTPLLIQILRNLKRNLIKIAWRLFRTLYTSEKKSNALS